MKKLFALPILFLFVISCKKTSSTNTTTTPSPDTTAPVITLVGSVNDTVSLNSTYTNPGATAIDNVDGNISANVVVSGTINKDLVGEYRLYYNVKDAAGNSAVQLTRYVYVANDADYLEGNYSAANNCGASGTASYTTALLASTTVNNKISFGIQGNNSGITPVIMVNANAINIAQQTNGANSVSGTGTIAANKKSFTLSHTSVGVSTGTWACTTNYTKQ
jgi:hypothetical protein